MGDMMCRAPATARSTTTPRIPLLPYVFLGLASTVMSQEADAEEEWAAVERRGAHLVTGAAERPFIIHGFNTYWLMSFAADEATRPRVTAAIAEAAGAGLNVCRTWAFADGGYHALQTAPFCYDEEVFQALDFVVSEARRYKMRLILSLCNNWEDYGGKAQYVRWGKEAGVDLTSDDDFFSDPTLKGYYKAFVEAVLSRINTITNEAYKEDPTILAWELINEPRCPSDPSGDTLQAWIEEMASYVKSIDTVHLVEIGIEGYYGPSTPELLLVNPDDYSGHVGTDFIRNHQTLGIDLASVHIYSDTWLPDSTEERHVQFVNTWMQQHIDDAANLLAMPIVIGEFGLSLKDGKFENEFRETFMQTVYNNFLGSWESGMIGGGCLLWQLFPEGAEHMDDGYAVIFAKSPSTFNLLANHSRKLEC
ncbi:mannan endo-1,4-beta-mannosidase 8-like [Hordeum vulgare subsp. vulgare]|uniref:mannan endo-1,4-beta-mannosidase n=2 Tax=Hordeum vulgare subsp. vulgare TaxID=112509 RepID=A0A8I6XLI4_HORVV|nr:mannan endo-1,4-beta-mannosidase 8-like [Hordeum vulgare subsp. vulgare]